MPILLVDDNVQILKIYDAMLTSSGIKKSVAIDDSREVIPFLSEKQASLIVLDLKMPHISGEELLVKINQNYPEIPVIIITGTDDITTAVECMKNGAVDYLVKPIEKNRFISSINRALEIRHLKNAVTSLKHYILSDELKNENAFSEIITSSKKMHGIFKYIEAISNSPFPVLITGETGVGKELIARSIHLSGEDNKNFIAVNVSGLDDNMFSDTLFGHSKGAFTGADHYREGLISQAIDGSLFLDEIGDLNIQSQIKLLRLIQEKEYYPLGSDRPKKANTRIIVATNKDLKDLVREQNFRKDLYFRLSTHQIEVPPLRERQEDILLLIDHFLDKAAKILNKRKPTPPPELFTLLSTYDFPGNVREMETLLYDAVSRHKSGILSMESFRKIIGEQRGEFKTEKSEEEDSSDLFMQFPGNLPTLKEAENFLIREALKRSGGNQGIAASLLGISRQALNKRLIREKKEG